MSTTSTRANPILTSLKHAETHPLLMWQLCVVRSHLVTITQLTYVTSHVSTDKFTTAPTLQNTTPLDKLGLETACASRVAKFVSKCKKFSNPEKWNTTMCTVLPDCVSRLTIQLSTCTSCCCRDGYLKSDLQHALLLGDDKKCGVTFAAGDFMARFGLGLWRLFLTARNINKACFLTPTHH